MGKIYNIIITIDKVIVNILKYITITVFSLIMLIMSINVFIRFVPVFSMHWLDEIIEMLFAALVFYGAAALWFTKGHFSAGNYISRQIKNQRIQNLYSLFLELMVLSFLAVFLYYGFNLFMRASDVTNAFGIPKKVLYSSMPISGVIMVYCIIKNVIIEIIGVVKPEAAKEILGKKIS
jgi:TRAP-type transport system small permease protein